MNNLQEKLEGLSNGKSSKWLDKAKWRKKNRKWLDYSSNIARRILSAIDERSDMSQNELAKKIGASPQYISQVVKGEENLSLQTIAKLSDALETELISFPEYKLSHSTSPNIPVLWYSEEHSTTSIIKKTIDKNLNEKDNIAAEEGEKTTSVRMNIRQSIDKSRFEDYREESRLG